MESCDVFIVGGGAAGLSAARAALLRGCGRVVLADRGPEPGGVLRQCFHPGFGSALTGPDYIYHILSDFPPGAHLYWNTEVTSVDGDRTAILSSPEFGLKRLRFAQMILAAGCREIAFGSLNITGDRPAGILTAGQLQRDMNLYGHVPPGPAVILGSGDMGWVAAWQLAEAGVEIAAMVEMGPEPGGLARSRARLTGRHVPVQCGATVSRVFGEEALEAVEIRNISAGSVRRLDCRTLVIAAGMRPDRSIVEHLGSPEWLRLCGNCARIHPMVEGVVLEGTRAGYLACEGLKGVGL